MKPPAPRTLVAAALLVAAGATIALAIRADNELGPAPNVVLITLDTTRADHLGCYGYDQPTSPNLDRLAARSTQFDNAMCTASVTPVSHASILTGQYPYTHGLRVLHGLTENRLAADAVTLAEVLRERGLATAAFISAFPAGSRFGLQQGFDVFDEDYLVTPMEQIVSQQGAINTGSNQRRAAETTDRALAWMEGVADPFFLWLHYFDPHDTQLLPPDEYLADLPAVKGPPRLRLKTYYDIEIRYMDLHIGRVLAALEARDQLENTVIVVVSDHGEGLGDHAWWTHGLLYGEQIRAPLIIHAPGIAPGRRVDHLVRTVDVMPTVLDLVGLDPEDAADLDGESLAPLLAGDASDPGYTAYADSINMLTYTVTPRLQDRKSDMLFAVMDGQWKYIHHFLRGGESELYHVTEDPGELHNLFESQPEQVQRLLADLQSRPFAPDPGHGQGRMSAEDLERLRSLGYNK